MKKVKFSRKILPLAIILGTVSFFSLYSAFAAGTVYFFCDTANDHDPANANNYYSNSGCSISAGFVPDSSNGDAVTVSAGALYIGNAIFNGIATNEGVVQGNATFNTIDTDIPENNGIITGNATFSGAAINAGTVEGNATFTGDSHNALTGIVEGDATFTGDGGNELVNDGSVEGNAIFSGQAVNNGPIGGNAILYNNVPNNGTISGTKTRRLTTSIGLTQNFVTTGPWTVIADDVAVYVSDATFDNTTVFSTIGSGSFQDVFLDPVRSYVDQSILNLTYSNTLSTSSVPVAGDYTVLVNGSAVSVTNISIAGAKIMLTLAGGSSLTGSDTISVSYTPGVSPLQSSRNIDVISLTNQAILVSIPAGDFPFTSVVANNKLYVVSSNDASVLVIDSSTGEIETTINLLGNANFIATVGDKVYVSVSSANNVTVIDATTDTIATTVTTGDNPYAVVAAGKKIYVSNTGDDTVSVINTLTDTVVATIPVGTSPWYGTVVGTKIYFNNLNSNTVTAIDTLTDAVVATIPVGFQPKNSGALGYKLYVGNSGTNTVSVINTLTDTVSTTVTVGNNPYYFIPVGNKMFVTNTASDSVTVIATASDTVFDTIAVGDAPFYSIGYGTKFFVANLSGSVSVIDTLTNLVTDTIPVGGSPYFLTIYNDKIYTSNTTTDNISVIEPATIPSVIPNLISFTSSTASGTYASGQAINITANFGRTLLAGSTMTVALNSGGSAILSTVSGSTLSGTYTIGSGDATPDLSVSSVTSASVTDTHSHTRTSYSLPVAQGSLSAENSFITKNIGDSKNIVIGPYQSTTVGTNPYQISSPVTVSGISYAYVANQGSNTVSVVRLSDNTVTSTITVGSEPYGLTAVGISGTTYVYVANIGSNTVSVINTSTNTVTATINVGKKPYYVTVVGANVYVTNGASNTVSVIDTSINTVTATIGVGVYPRGIKAHGTNLYVANYGNANYGGGNSISIIDTGSNTVTDTILLPAGSSGPRGVAILGSKAYIANYRSNNVSVIDTATNSVAATIAVGAGPRGIVGLSGKIYVENFDDGTISVIDTSDNTVSATVSVGHSPSGMAISGTDIYVSRFQDNLVSILDTLTNSLAVVSAPGQPTALAATAGGGQIMLTWTAPTSNGRSAITDYFIEYKLSSSGSWSTFSDGISASTTSTVTGLTNNSAYDFRVSAINSTGTGIVSSTTTATPVVAGHGGSGGFPSIPIPPVTLPITPPAKPIKPPHPVPHNPGISPPTFKGNLSIGSVGLTVFNLQKYLNTNGFVLAASGPGSPGKETYKFGILTQKALKKFQQAYAEEILWPQGFKKGTGILGPATKKFICGC